MPSISNATARRIRHASGYLGLGMLHEASEELEAIEGEDRLTTPVMAARADLYMETKQWDLLIGVAREISRVDPENEQGWIHHAYALRELNRIEEAKAVLHQAEPLHGKTCGVLHYNLACYACLLGDKTEARRRLGLACKMDKQWKQHALDDPDLKAMRDEIAAMK